MASPPPQTAPTTSPVPGLPLGGGLSLQQLKAALQAAYDKELLYGCGITFAAEIPDISADVKIPECSDDESHLGDLGRLLRSSAIADADTWKNLDASLEEYAAFARRLCNLLAAFTLRPTRRVPASLQSAKWESTCHTHKELLSFPSSSDTPGLTTTVTAAAGSPEQQQQPTAATVADGRVAEADSVGGGPPRAAPPHNSAAAAGSVNQLCPPSAMEQTDVLARDVDDPNTDPGQSRALSKVRVLNCSYNVARGALMFLNSLCSHVPGAAQELSEAKHGVIERVGIMLGGDCLPSCMDSFVSSVLSFLSACKVFSHISDMELRLFRRVSLMRNLTKATPLTLKIVTFSTHILRHSTTANWESLKPAAAHVLCQVMATFFSHYPCERNSVGETRVGNQDSESDAPQALPQSDQPILLHYKPLLDKFRPPDSRQTSYLCALLEFMATLVDRIFTAECLLKEERVLVKLCISASTVAFVGSSLVSSLSRDKKAHAHLDWVRQQSDSDDLSKASRELRFLSLSPAIALLTTSPAVVRPLIESHRVLEAVCAVCMEVLRDPCDALGLCKGETTRNSGGQRGGCAGAPALLVAPGEAANSRRVTFSSPPKDVPGMTREDVDSTARTRPAGFFRVKSAVDARQQLLLHTENQWVTYLSHVLLVLLPPTSPGHASNDHLNVTAQHHKWSVTGNVMPYDVRGYRVSRRLDVNYEKFRRTVLSDPPPVGAEMTVDSPTGLLSNTTTGESWDVNMLQMAVNVDGKVEDLSRGSCTPHFRHTHQEGFTGLGPCGRCRCMRLAPGLEAVHLVPRERWSPENVSCPLPSPVWDSGSVPLCANLQCADKPECGDAGVRRSVERIIHNTFGKPTTLWPVCKEEEQRYRARAEEHALALRIRASWMQPAGVAIPEGRALLHTLTSDPRWFSQPDSRLTGSNKGFNGHSGTTCCSSQSALVGSKACENPLSTMANVPCTSKAGTGAPPSATRDPPASRVVPLGAVPTLPLPHTNAPTGTLSLASGDELTRDVPAPALPRPIPSKMAGAVSDPAPPPPPPPPPCQPYGAVHPSGGVQSRSGEGQAPAGQRLAPIPSAAVASATDHLQSSRPIRANSAARRKRPHWLSALFSPCGADGSVGEGTTDIVEYKGENSQSEASSDDDTASSLSTKETPESTDPRSSATVTLKETTITDGASTSDTLPERSRLRELLRDPDAEVVGSHEMRQSAMRFATLQSLLMAVIPSMMKVAASCCEPIVARHCSVIILRCLSLIAEYLCGSDTVAFSSGKGKLKDPHGAWTLWIYQALNALSSDLLFGLTDLLLANDDQEPLHYNVVVERHPFCMYEELMEWMEPVMNIGRLSNRYTCYSLSTKSERRVAAADSLCILFHLSSIFGRTPMLRGGARVAPPPQGSSGPWRSTPAMTPDAKAWAPRALLDEAAVRSVRARLMEGCRVHMKMGILGPTQHPVLFHMWPTDQKTTFLAASPFMGCPYHPSWHDMMDVYERAFQRLVRVMYAEVGAPLLSAALVRNKTPPPSSVSLCSVTGFAQSLSVMVKSRSRRAAFDNDKAMPTVHPQSGGPPWPECELLVPKRMRTQPDDPTDIASSADPQTLRRKGGASQTCTEECVAMPTAASVFPLRTSPSPFRAPVAGSSVTPSTLAPFYRPSTDVHVWIPAGLDVELEQMLAAIRERDVDLLGCGTIPSGTPSVPQRTLSKAEPVSPCQQLRDLLLTRAASLEWVHPTALRPVVALAEHLSEKKVSVDRVVTHATALLDEITEVTTLYSSLVEKDQAPEFRELATCSLPDGVSPGVAEELMRNGHESSCAADVLSRKSRTAVYHDAVQFVRAGGELDEQVLHALSSLATLLLSWFTARMERRSNNPPPGAMRLARPRSLSQSEPDDWLSGKPERPEGIARDLAKRMCLIHLSACKPPLPSPPPRPRRGTARRRSPSGTPARTAEGLLPDESVPIGPEVAVNRARNEITIFGQTFKYWDIMSMSTNPLYDWVSTTPFITIGGLERELGNSMRAAEIHATKKTEKLERGRPPGSGSTTAATVEKILAELRVSNKFWSSTAVANPHKEEFHLSALKVNVDAYAHKFPFPTDSSGFDVSRRPSLVLWGFSDPRWANYHEDCHASTRLSRLSATGKNDASVFPPDLNQSLERERAGDKQHTDAFTPTASTASTLSSLIAPSITTITSPHTFFADLNALGDIMPSLLASSFTSIPSSPRSTPPAPPLSPPMDWLNAPPRHADRPRRRVPPTLADHVLLLINGVPLLNREQRLFEVIAAMSPAFDVTRAEVKAFHQIIASVYTSASGDPEDRVETEPWPEASLLRYHQIKEVERLFTRNLPQRDIMVELQVVVLRSPFARDSLRPPTRCGCAFQACRKHGSAAPGTLPLPFIPKCAASVERERPSDRTAGKSGEPRRPSVKDLRKTLEKDASAERTQQSWGLCSGFHLLSSSSHSRKKQHGHEDVVLRLLAALTKVLRAHNLSFSSTSLPARRLYNTLLQDVFRHKDALRIAPLMAYTAPSYFTAGALGGIEALYALWNYPHLFSFHDRSVVFLRLAHKEWCRSTKAEWAGHLGAMDPSLCFHAALKDDGTPASDYRPKFRENPSYDLMGYQFPLFNREFQYAISRERLLDECTAILRRRVQHSSVFSFAFLGDVGVGPGPHRAIVYELAHALTSPRLGIWVARRVEQDRSREMEEAAAPAREAVSRRSRRFHVAADMASRNFATVMPLFPCTAPPDANAGYWYETLGMLAGQGILDLRTLPFHFHPLFLRALRGDAVAVSEAEARQLLPCVNPPIERSLRRLEAFSEADLSAVAIENMLPDLGTPRDAWREVFLSPDGHPQVLTRANVCRYCTRVRQYILQDLLTTCVGHFRAGLATQFPPILLRLFSEQELDWLLSTRKVRFWATREAFEKVLVPQRPYTLTTRVVAYLTELIPTWSAEEQHQLLAFVSGSSTLGLNEAPPTLTVIPLYPQSRLDEWPRHEMNPPDGDTDQQKTDALLPNAFTCHLYLMLPNYSSKEVLDRQLRRAIKEAGNYFVFV